MRRVASNFLGIALLIIYQSRICESALFSENGPVSELSSIDFKRNIQASPGPQKPVFIVLFYSSLCNHCRRFAPYFEATAEALRAAPGIRFAAIDAVNPDNYDVFMEKNIRFFPMVYIVISNLDHQSASWKSDWQELKCHPSETFLTRLIVRMPHLASFASTLAEPLKVFILPNNINPSSPLAMNLDAIAALSIMLNTEVFRGNEDILTTEKLQGLRTLLQLCLNILTIPDVRRDCDILYQALGEQVPFSREVWNSLLKMTKSLKPSGNEQSFRTCQTYSCALWRLLHLFSLGPVDSKDSEAEIRPIDAMNGIRTIADLFFSCSECRDHFLDGFDECLFDRCAVPGSRMNWFHTGLWLWKFHNSVSQRVKNNTAVWPDSQLCPSCFVGDTNRDEERVLEFLHDVFWMHESDVTEPIVSSGLNEKNSFRPPLYSKWAISLSLICAVFVFH